MSVEKIAIVRHDGKDKDLYEIRVDVLLSATPRKDGKGVDFYLHNFSDGKTEKGKEFQTSAIVEYLPFGKYVIYFTQNTAYLSKLRLQEARKENTKITIHISIPQSNPNKSCITFKHMGLEKKAIDYTTVTDHTKNGSRGAIFRSPTTKESVLHVPDHLVRSSPIQEAKQIGCYMLIYTQNSAYIVHPITVYNCEQPSEESKRNRGLEKM
jgi:hypothetical protein